MVSRLACASVDTLRTDTGVEVALYTALVVVCRDLQYPCVFLGTVGFDDGRCERDGEKNGRLGGSQGGEGYAAATDCEGWEAMEADHGAYGRLGRSVPPGLIVLK